MAPVLLPELFATRLNSTRFKLVAIAGKQSKTACMSSVKLVSSKHAAGAQASGSFQKWRAVVASLPRGVRSLVFGGALFFAACGLTGCDKAGSDSAGSDDKHGDFVSLFNGKDLTGWEKHSGEAEYRVEEGAIVGKTVANSGNTFLCTAKKYGNFILEFEFKVAPELNSGVQFRSEFFDAETEVNVEGKPKKFPADRVFGYQFEIDPSPRSYTAGIYDEGRRGWLANLQENEPARKAFKAGDWNKGRIECRKDKIKTFINGVKAAEVTDFMTPTGIIGLQVHGIGKGKAPGDEVRWRNIRIREL